MIIFAGMEMFTYKGQDLDVRQVIALTKSQMEIAPAVWAQVTANRQNMLDLLSR